MKKLKIKNVINVKAEMWANKMYRYEDMIGIW